MLRDAAVAILQKRLGNRTDLADDIVTEMQLQQLELEQAEVLPWFLMTTDATLTTEVGAPDQLVIPSDFLREVEEDALEWYNVDTWTQLDKDDYDRIKRADLTDFTAPSYYAILGPSLFFRPSPTEQITLRWTYYAKAALLTSNIENVWLEHAPGVLINATGHEMAKYLQNPKLEALFAKSLARSVNAMWTQDEQRKLSNQDLRMTFAGAEE